MLWELPVFLMCCLMARGVWPSFVAERVSHMENAIAIRIEDHAVFHVSSCAIVVVFALRGVAA